MENERRIAEAKNVLESVNGWINNCDTKAGTLLALIGVILTIVFTNDGIENACRIITTIIPSKLLCDYIFLILWVCSLIYLLYGLYKLISVLIGRIDRKFYKQPGLTLDSKIFYGAIDDNKSFQEYKEKVIGTSEESYLNDLLSQIFINSKIANTKFKNYNKGLKASLIGFVAFIALFIMGMFLYLR